jgi:flagellar assembly factor FliW
MQITTTLGAIPVDPAKVLTFPRGLPGFEECTRFFLVECEELSPIQLLVAVDTPDLLLPVLGTLEFDPTYQPALDPGLVRDLGAAGTAELALMAVVTISEEGRRVTANLRGPLVINPARQLGCQTILPDERYSLRYPLVGGPNGGGA